MSLSPATAALVPAWSPAAFSAGAVLAYGLAAWPARRTGAAPEAAAGVRQDWMTIGGMALLVAWLLHLATLAVDIGGEVWLLGSFDAGESAALKGPRLGFAPVLSASAWLVIAVHAVESRLVPVPAVRVGLAAAGALTVALAWFFPGELRPFTTMFGPWHFVLGVASYALIAAAVLHGLWLGAAERRMRSHLASTDTSPTRALGMPLLQLERLTFRFVQAGFAVLSLALLLGLLTPRGMHVEHKTVFSLLAWACFAVLLWGRASRGWRGRVALRWLYAGALLLLLAYAGSRFVFEVLLERPWR